MNKQNNSYTQTTFVKSHMNRKDRLLLKNAIGNFQKKQRENSLVWNIIFQFLLLRNPQI